MKRIITLLAMLLISLAAWGQFNRTAKRAGTHIKLDGKKLSRAEQIRLLSNINGADYTHQWNQAATIRNTGMGLTIGGGVVMVGGAAVMIAGTAVTAVGATTGAAIGVIGGAETAKNTAQQGASAGKPIITGGLIATLTGLAATIAGVPMLAVGCTRMKRICDRHNAFSSVEVSWGPAPSGVGLCVRF